MTERPIGVFLLSILLTIGGVIALPASIWMIFNYRALAPLSEASGITVVVVLFSLFFVGIAALAGGVGMMLGTRWGWYCGTFYCVYSASVALSALERLASQQSDFPLSEATLQEQYLKFTIRAIGSALIVMYLVRRRVKESLQAEDVNSVRAISIMVAICAGISLVATGVNFISVALPTSG